jgi:hypothetical protein
MPGRDGTGPSGQGSRTGWGMGDCAPEKEDSSQTLTSEVRQRPELGERMWDATFRRWMKRRRANRIHGRE